MEPKFNKGDLVTLTSPDYLDKERNDRYRDRA